MKKGEVDIKEVNLIDLARMAHIYESEDNDVDFMRVMDEVDRRRELTNFCDLYILVWKEFSPRRCNNNH